MTGPKKIFYSALKHGWQLCYSLLVLVYKLMKLAVIGAIGVMVYFFSGPIADKLAGFVFDITHRLGQNRENDSWLGRFWRDGVGNVPLREHVRHYAFNYAYVFTPVIMLAVHLFFNRLERRVQRRPLEPGEQAPAETNNLPPPSISEATSERPVERDDSSAEEMISHREALPSVEQQPASPGSSSVDRLEPPHQLTHHSGHHVSGEWSQTPALTFLPLLGVRQEPPFVSASTSSSWPGLLMRDPTQSAFSESAVQSGPREDPQAKIRSYLYQAQERLRQEHEETLARKKKEEAQKEEQLKKLLALGKKWEQEGKEPKPQSRPSL